MKIQKLVLFCAVFAHLHAPVYGIEKFNNSLVTKVQSDIDEEKQSSSTIGAIIGTSMIVLGVIGYFIWKHRKPQNRYSKQLKELTTLWTEAIIAADEKKPLSEEQQRALINVLDATLWACPPLSCNNNNISTHLLALEKGIRSGTIIITKELLAIAILEQDRDLLDIQTVKMLLDSHKLTTDLVPEGLTYKEIKEKVGSYRLGNAGVRHLSGSNRGT